MNYKLAIYCKTYHRDFQRVSKLLESINKFNRDNIPVFVSCPKSEYSLLLSTVGKENYTYIEDEAICELNPRFLGWKSQTLYKLNAYTQIPAENILKRLFLERFYSL